MASCSSSKCSSMDYETVEPTCAEDLEEYDRSTELPVIKPSSFKIPVGAMVSPLSPLFIEKAKICTPEKVAAEAFQEGIRSTRSCSISTSWSSSDSAECSSISGGITPLSETSFPATMPRIAYADWQKFGIELYTPKLNKPDPDMYYEYHLVSSRRIPQPTRPRNRRSNSQPTSTSVFESHSTFDSEEVPNKPRLLLRRATLEGYYCPEL